MKKRFFAESVYYKLNGEVVDRWIEVFHYSKHKFYFNEAPCGGMIVIAKTLKQAVDKYLSYELETSIDADILDLLTGEYSPYTLEGEDGNFYVS